MVRICLTRNELEGPHELGRRKSKRFSSRQNLGRWQNATRSEILWKSFMGKFNTFFVHDELLHQRRCIISHFCVVHTKTSFALGPPPGKQFRTAEHWISLFFPQMFKSCCENCSKRVKKKKSTCNMTNLKWSNRLFWRWTLMFMYLRWCRNNGEGLLSVEQKVLFTGLRPSTFAQPF